MLRPFLRRSDFVRQLNTDTVINGDNAFIDRIELDIGDWVMSGNRDQICSALSDLRLAEIPTNDGEVVPLFNNHLVERFYDIRRLRFSTNPRVDALNRSSALIAGSVVSPDWRFRRVMRQPDETERIAFRTQLNLTRFIQAQRLHRRSRLDRPRLASDYVMAITPDPAWYVDEVPLLPATNIVIGPTSKYAFALRDSRVSQMRQYLTVTQEMLQDVMVRAFDRLETTARHMPYFSLRSIEFYWEFDEDSPIDFVVSLRERMMQHGEQISEDFYEITNASIRMTNQSPCLTIHLTRNIKIKVYAKTTRRVRFEVTLKDDAINQAANQRSQESVDGIVSLIPALAEAAADRLSPLLQSVVTAPPPPGSATAVQLMHLITQDAHDHYIAEAIIAALVSFGRVVPYANDPLRNAVHRLRDRGVLRTIQPRSRIYVVTDEYQTALRSLRQYR